MSKWKKNLEDEVSAEHEQRVLAAMRPLLKQNAKLATGSKSKPWWVFAGPALALGALAILLVPRALTPTPAPAPEKLEIALDYDMYTDLHEIQELELLQKLGDPEKWPTKKAKPGKS